MNIEITQEQLEWIRGRISDWFEYVEDDRQDYGYSGEILVDLEKRLNVNENDD